MNNLDYEKFVTVLQNQADFGVVSFSPEQIEQFWAYYQLVLKWNPFLHLTTITNPADFALYNILEAAFALSQLSATVTTIFDIGAGAGIPGVPISILRPQFPINLVEANKKKSIFLKEAASSLSLTATKVLNQRFEELPVLPATACLVSRALDDLPKLIPALMNFGLAGQQMILLGNAELFDKAIPFIPPNWQRSILSIPKSQNRYVISFLNSSSST